MAEETTFIQKRYVVASDTAPASPFEGQVWLDTSGATAITKQYNGTSWVTVGNTIDDVTITENVNGEIQVNSLSDIFLWSIQTETTAGSGTVTYTPDFLKCDTNTNTSAKGKASVNTTNYSVNPSSSDSLIFNINITTIQSSSWSRCIYGLNAGVFTNSASEEGIRIEIFDGKVYIQIGDGTNGSLSGATSLNQVETNIDTLKLDWDGTDTATVTVTYDNGSTQTKSFTESTGYPTNNQPIGFMAWDGTPGADYQTAFKIIGVK